MGLFRQGVEIYKSHQKPLMITEELRAYIAGVICSDGYLTDRALGLKAKDKDFVDAFKNAVNTVYGRACNVNPDGKYWRTIYSNKTGIYSELKYYKPETKKELSSWVRGYFDGDGNASLVNMPKISPNAFTRRIGFYSTDEMLLLQARNYLLILGMDSILRPRKLSASHYGKKPMFELVLRNSKNNFSVFAKLIGSSIRRKRLVIESIPKSYQPPGHHKRIQLIGAEAKHWNLMTKTVPRVVVGIRDTVIQGINPTQRNCCRLIPGYSSVQRYFTQADLIELAEEFMKCVP